MTVVTVERCVEGPIERLWTLVTDFAALRLPLTHFESEPGRPGVGWRFTGVSGVGRVAIRDSMVVTRWLPPAPDRDTAEYAVVKTGWVLGGWAEVTLTRSGPSETALRWREEILLRPRVLGVPLAGITAVAVRAMFERAVDDLVGRA